MAWVSVPAKVTRQARFSEDKLVHEDLRDIVEEIVQRRGKDNTVLFPRWIKVEDGSDAERIHLEDLMKNLNEEAANKYKWPATTSFHGTHNFRHGAAQDAHARGGTKLVMMRTGHLSEGCANYYARSDLERSKKSLFARAGATKQLNQIKEHVDRIRNEVKKMRESFKLNDITIDDDGSPLFDLTHQEEQELEQLVRHSTMQAESYAARSNKKRATRRQRESGKQEEVIPYNVPEERLIVPRDQTAVILVLDNNLREVYARLPTWVADRFLNVPPPSVADVSRQMEIFLKYHWKPPEQYGPIQPREDFIDAANYPKHFKV